jgi:MAM domain.
MKMVRDKRGIGYKDSTGTYGFALTSTGSARIGNTSDDVIQVTGTLEVNGDLKVFNDTLVRNTVYAYDTTTTLFNESFEGLSDGSTSDPSANGTWTNGLGNKDGTDIANGYSWIAEDTDANSSGTGPDNAHSGSIYVFTEASSRTNKYYTLQRSFTSPESKKIGKLSLYYHMFGANMGSLAVYASSSYLGGWSQLNITADVDGTPAVASSISGQQHSAETDNYKRAEVNLDTYTGVEYSLRIVGLTGGNFPSDLAIDAIEFIPKSTTLNVSATSVSASVPVSASTFYSDAIHTDDDSMYVEVVRRKSDSSTTTKIRLMERK